MWTDSAVEAVDLHVAGVPVRVVANDRLGWSADAGPDTWLARLRADDGGARLRLSHEPWGFEGMQGVWLMPAHRPGSAGSAVFWDADGYAPWCGRGLAALAAFLVRTGRAPAGEVAVDTALGTVRLEVEDSGDAPAVRVAPPPARAVARGLRLEGQGFTVDLAVCGGKAYAFLPSPVPIDLEGAHVLALRERAASLLEPVAPLAGRAGDLAALVFAAAPEGDRVHRLCPVGATGRLHRAPGVRLLAAYAALRRGDGEALPLAAAGLSGVQTTVEGADDGPRPDGQVRVTVALRPHVVAFRRFYHDPYDPVAPFLVP
ncbi:MAG: proline racemase family protein [Firmicutes bacterium]|nr:proline racemase family protein [Bacillota bacterium]